MGPGGEMDRPGPRIALLRTCLVDLYRPSVAEAAGILLQRVGCLVTPVAAPACCGQPNYNSGDANGATKTAKQLIAALEPYDYVVVPAGSCAGMIRVHYPNLLADDGEWRHRAGDIAKKTFELTQFLTEIKPLPRTTGSWSGSVAYHDSCSCLRELGLKKAPRDLLCRIDGIDLRDIPDAESCCGFGGAFTVKFPDISGAMAQRKTGAIADTGAETLTSTDLGCLLHLAGKLRRDGQKVAVRHIAEILAGMMDIAPIETSEDEGRS